MLASDHRVYSVHVGTKKINTIGNALRNMRFTGVFFFLQI